MKTIEPNSSQLELIKNIELNILEEIDRICRNNDIPYTLAYGTLLGAIRHKGFIPWDDDIDICIPRKDYVRFRAICKKELDSRFFYQSHYTDPGYYHLFDKIRANDTVFRESFLSKRNIHHGIFVDIFPLDNLPDRQEDAEKQIKIYRFLRVILYSKFLILSARKGKKKLFASIVRFLTPLVPMDYLYKKAEEIASKFQNEDTDTVGILCAGEHYPAAFYKNRIETDFCGKSFYIPERYDDILRTEYGNYMELPPVEQRETIHTLVELKLYNI